MGHRHQTYILVTDEVTKETNLTVYHCQWNYPMVQIPKILRFAEYFIPKLNELNRCEAQYIPMIYQYTASLAPNNFIHHKDITDEYKKYQDYLFNEDNNNGWLLIHVKLYSDKEKNTIFIGFKPGSENIYHKEYTENQGGVIDKFINLFEYLNIVLDQRDRKELFADDNLTDKERHLLEWINNRGIYADELRNSTDLLEVKTKQLYTDRIKVFVEL